MIDMDTEERTLLLEAGKAGGEYLEELGITDMRLLSLPQWEMFLRCIIGRYFEARGPYEDRIKAMVREEMERDGVPFA